MYIRDLPDHISKLTKQSFPGLPIRGRTYFTLLADRFFHLNTQNSSKLGQYSLVTPTTCTKPMDHDASGPIS